MPIFNMKCVNEDCAKPFEILCKRDEIDEVRCPHCNDQAEQCVAAFGSYAIKGNNSASVTPKRFRTQGK